MASNVPREAVLWYMTALCTFYGQEPDNELDKESEDWSTALLERAFFLFSRRRMLFTYASRYGHMLSPAPIMEHATALASLFADSGTC